MQISNKIHRYWIIAVILLNLTSSQQLFSQLKEEDVKAFNIKNLQERLYVRTDRDIYITGEQVWFKVYKMDGLTNTPSDISKVVYIELLDNNNYPLRQIKIETQGNSGYSNFSLPENMSSGKYILRAYTNWMKN